MSVQLKCKENGKSELQGSKSCMASHSQNDMETTHCSVSFTVAGAG